MELHQYEIYQHSCAECAPTEWPGPVVDHACASRDEDGLYGTIVYTRPRRSGSLHDRYVVRAWPTCARCGKGYCTWCGVKEWYQTL